MLSLLAAAACARAPDGPPDDSAVLATYDGGRFTADDFRRIVERMPGRTAQGLEDLDARHEFVEGQVLNELLARAGRARGYDRDPDIAAQVRDFEERLVVQRVIKDLQEPPPLAEEDLRAAYEANARLYSGGQVRVRHILVKDPALAERLRAEVVADPERFPALAKEHSLDNVSKTRGGDLGFFGQGRMVADFERAAFALEKPGDVSAVVKTPFGYHVIILVDSRDVVPRPFAEVKNHIRVGLMGQRRQSLLAERYDALMEEAGVTIDDQALADLELPPPNPALQSPRGH